MSARYTIVLAAALLFAACARVQSPEGSFIPQTEQRPAAAATGTLVVRVTMHRTPHSPRYLSPSSKGMTVDVKGPTSFKKTVGLVVGSNGCHSKLMDLQCALRVSNLKSCPSKKACYTAAIDTYDAYANKKVPPGAHLLSAVSGFKFFVGTGTTFIPLVLGGIPASVAFIPSTTSALTGSQTPGFVFPKCTTTPQSVTLIGVDADGNYIVGPGAPTTSLTSGNPAQMTVAAMAANVFTLGEPPSPAYPYGNYTNVLSAAAKPAGKGLGSGAVSNINVTYSGDICGTFKEFAIPTSSSGPWGITVGPDGNLWFTEFTAGKIASITTAGVIKEFPISATSHPSFITAGPDGNIWFTENAASKIGKMTTNGVVVFEKMTTTASSRPMGITTGSDGNLWFTECAAGANKIGAITTSGTLLPEIPIPTSGAVPFAIVSGPDGNLWFTENNASRAGTVTTNGSSISDSPTLTANSNPFGIASAHGALWFVEASGNKVARVDTLGRMTTEIPLPEPASAPVGIATGPDGNLWLTETLGNRIARFGFDGTFFEYAVPTSGSAPFFMTTGPDGALWFLEQNANNVGRLW